MATHSPIAMKTLHREAQQARPKTAPVPAPAPEHKTEGAPAVEAFTARELDAAEQLIHLSGSSASSGAPPRARARRAPGGPGCSLSSRSVGAPPVLVPAPAVLLGGCVDCEEDEEHEVAGRPRRVKRYRLIEEISAATKGIGGRTGTGRKNKNKKE